MMGVERNDMMQDCRDPKWSTASRPTVFLYLLAPRNRVSPGLALAETSREARFTRKAVTSFSPKGGIGVPGRSLTSC